MGREVWTVDDLVRAWRDVRAVSGAPADLREYDRGRHEAFADVFEADLNRPPDPKPPMPV